MPNHLALETSPYLLQHQHNPVDWYPWGPEALERARNEDKPIFLSIGYSACHWCHVMEHESFENEAIAAALNRDFVAIKVDREERPDLDQIYMNAVQMLTGRGGWPMSVFLTPGLQPFFGGTYWPPGPRMGMPGFDQVLAAVADAWANRREALLEQAGQLTDHLQAVCLPDPGDGPLAASLIHAAVAQLERVFDFTHGGFGGAPKFPHPMDLRLLLRAWRRDRRDGVLTMVQRTLDKMAAGGIYDHLGGGFARYCVDARWLVPHFEKMLYDNALLAVAYTEAFLATGEPRYAQVVRETCDYVLRDMTDPAGGFYSSEDADSEGVEGKFYVWTPAEIARVLGDEAVKTFCYVYDVTEEGNFEGQSILNLPKSIEQCAGLLSRDPAELERELADARAKLLEVRSRRVRPGRDDKVLVSWNAMMIEALALAAGALGESRYLEAATRAATFVCGTLRRDDGRLLHTWRDGQAKLDAYLDDYACLANSLVSLYEASFDERWIDEAVVQADLMLEHFADRDGGGFYFTADDHERLIARTKDLHDASVPSGNGMAAFALIRLAHLTGEARYREAAESTLRLGRGLLQQHPTAAGQLLLALDFHLGPTPQIAILGDRRSDDTRAVIESLRRRFLPNVALGFRADSSPGSDHLAALFADKPAVDPLPTVYVCQDFTCQAPVSGRDAVEQLWDKLAYPPP